MIPTFYTPHRLNTIHNKCLQTTEKNEQRGDTKHNPLFIVIFTRNTRHVHVSLSFSCFIYVYLSLSLSLLLCLCGVLFHSREMQRRYSCEKLHSTCSTFFLPPRTSQISGQDPCFDLSVYMTMIGDLYEGWVRGWRERERERERKKGRGPLECKSVEWLSQWAFTLSLSQHRPFLT